MNTYSLLLVDDEEEVTQVIERKIDWSKLGFCVIGHANNGLKALEMIEEFQPDVVMTDIRMPYMDGMQLCGEIKSRYPTTKILLFTGFDEFEYAKEAVHLEIEEYILKPLNAIELTEVFAKLKQKLDQEIDEKRNVETLQKYYMDSLPLLQANFYSTLIEGRIYEEQLEQYLKDYQIQFEAPVFGCIVIHTSTNRVPEGMNPQLLAISVERQAKEQLAPKWKAKCFAYLGNTVLIVQLRQESEISELTDECDRFCKYVHRILGAVTTIGVGAVCNELLELSKSYQGAKEAVSYRVLYGSSRAINIKEIVPKKQVNQEVSSEGELLELFKMIRLGSEAQIEESVENYLKHLFVPSETLQKHHVALMELISTLYRFSENNEISSKEFSKEMGEIYQVLINLEPEGLKKWLLKVSLSFREQITDARSSSTKSLITKAKTYVESHYREEGLSLDDICEELGVSNSYFSSMFKKETGNSFVGYLTEYRMEKACKRLIETNEKSYMIAKSVGYTDANYFSYVFKRQYGVSPSKYRTEYAKGEK